MSDLYIDQDSDRAVISIDVPVRHADGTIFRILSLTVAPDVFDAMLRRQSVPDGWVVGVFDRQGTIVARQPRIEALIGQPVSPQLMPHLTWRQEGVIESETIDGVSLLSSFAHSERFDWGVGIGVPRAELIGPVYDTMVRTLLVGGIVLALSIALALALGRSVTGPIARLRALAAAPGPSAPTGLRETDEVAAALDAAEQGFRYLFESGLPKWVYAIDTLEMLAVNDRAVETYGYSRAEFLAMRVTDLYLEGQRARVRAVAAEPDRQRHTVDWQHAYKDGRVVDVETYSHSMTFAGRPARIVVVLDVTARKQAEAQLVHAQKMEAVGELTGGLAHDFNNLLSVVTGNLGLLRDGGRDDPDFEIFIDEALAAARRGADLTRSLLAFARRQPLRPISVDANRLVSDLSALLRRVLGEPIEIALDLGDGLWPVVVDPNQLEAALVNLATNARDAMPKGGQLRLATRNRQLDDDAAAGKSDVGPGDYVMIEVNDTGNGMTPEVAARVFEPFFTTKGRAQGTGLGLSMVFGFIKQSAGHIEVDSALGAGTTFRLYLPRAGAREPIAAMRTLEHIDG
ncbi:MAG: PAS domain S-box protein [Alphaproteobacteria bacterium]|nr:PAS domain S-box protein [Alphaproteobacteria bacterium]